MAPMGTIDLRPRLIGSGYVGTIDVGRAESNPTLSWVDRQALQGIVTSSQGDRGFDRHRQSGARERSSQPSAGWGLKSSSRLVILSGSLVYASPSRPRCSGVQLEALDRIEAALRHPAKVRAAERLVDAGKLLDQRRFDRALPLAEEASADDPLNPAAFGAAAWALLGLGRLGDAHDHFAEAAVAAERTERASYVRRQARVAFALDRVEEAEQALRAVLAESVSASERAASSYDLAIYVAGHDPGEAAERLRHAITYDSRYAVWALIDPLVQERRGLLAIAISALESLKEEMEDSTGQLHAAITSAEQRLAKPIDLTLSAREGLESALTAARALVDGQQADGRLASQGSELDQEARPAQHHDAALYGVPAEAVGEVARNAPLKRQLRETRRIRDALTTAVACYDEQTQALPRIRELMQAVEALQGDLGNRSEELQRLDRELHDAYHAASEYTQSLTNSLRKYRGRKYARKIRERDEASDRHMALLHESQDVRCRAIGTKPDPETERIRAELARVQAELRDLNPASYRDYIQRNWLSG